MSSALRLALGGMNRGILHCASRLVPREQRADWLREWSAELWHMRRSCPPVDGFSWKSEGVAAAFCLGAFQDAFCVRHLCREASVAASSQHGSAGECLLWLGGLLAVSYILTCVLPGVSMESPSALSAQPRAGVAAERTLHRQFRGNHPWATVSRPEGVAAEGHRRAGVLSDGEGIGVDRRRCQTEVAHSSREFESVCFAWRASRFLRGVERACWRLAGGCPER